MTRGRSLSIFCYTVSYMKKYLRILLIASTLLLLFPLLGLPELWEQLYVSIIGFIMGTTTLLLRHKSGLIDANDDDEEQSLQNYVHELQTRFRDHKKQTSGGRKEPAESQPLTEDTFPESHE